MMRCTVIPCEKRKHFIELWLDEEHWHTVHLSIFGGKPSISGTTCAECEIVFHRLEYQGAKRFVLKRLSLRSYHSLELSDAMRERLVSEATITKVIQEFTSMGYLNDLEWIENTIRRLQLQKCGPKAIEIKLRTKGLSIDASIQNALAAICDRSAQQNNIKRLLSSRYRSRNLADPKERHKVVAGLMRKGYPFNEIIEALNKSTV